MKSSSFLKGKILPKLVLIPQSLWTGTNSAVEKSVPIRRCQQFWESKELNYLRNLRNYEAIHCSSLSAKLDCIFYTVAVHVQLSDCFSTKPVSKLSFTLLLYYFCFACLFTKQHTFFDVLCDWQRSFLYFFICQKLYLFFAWRGTSFKPFWEKEVPPFFPCNNNLVTKVQHILTNTTWHTCLTYQKSRKIS